MIGDRLKSAVEGIVKRLVASYQYHAPYTAKIIAQAGDGTLEVLPDDPRLPSLTGIPLRTFVPGVDIKVKAGGTVLIQFENGDPSRPIATLFDGGSLESLSIKANTKIVIDAAEVDLVSSGGLPLARQGDMVASGGTTPAACMVTFIDPTPGPPAPVTTKIPFPAMIQFAPIPLTGTIVSGNPTRKA